MVPKIREWAYAGFGFTLIGALLTHIVTSTSVAMVIVAMVLFVTSYIYKLKLGK